MTNLVSMKTAPVAVSSSEEEYLHGHAPCVSCPSSDALAVYDNHVHCFSCKHHYMYTDPATDLPKFVATITRKNYTKKGQPKVIAHGEEAPAVGLVERKISKKTLDAYGVTVEYDNTGKIIKHFYPYLKQDIQQASKIRMTVEKDFRWSGSNDVDLFGQHLVSAGGRMITIVEGELDALSVMEMTGYPAVSVRSSSSVVDDCKRAFEYINSFETIVLAFDNDEDKIAPDGKVFNPGKDATEKVAKLFKPGKVKIMNLGKYKDANDFLVADDKQAWERAFWNARVFSVNGILPGSSLWDMITEEQDFSAVPYPFAGLNRKLYGLRTHELVTLTAGTGMGKTTLLKFLSVWVADNTSPGSNIGMIMLEESTRDTALGLMSAKAKIPFHLPDAQWTADQRKQAFEDTLGKDRFFIHENEHFDSSTINGILNQVRTMVKAYDCKYIILDHVSIVVSDQEHGDERRALDELVTKLKRLTMELGISIIIVSHLRRTQGAAAEEGGQVSLSDLRGTQAIAQLSNVVLALERNAQADDPMEARTTHLRVLKNRFCGRTGLAATITFDDVRYTFDEVEPEHPEAADKPEMKDQAYGGEGGTKH